MFDRPFFDLLLLPPLNRVVPARYDEELSCAMCGPVTVIKKEEKKEREKTGQGKVPLMSMEESNNSIYRVQKSHVLHSKTRNRGASIVI